MTTNLDKRAGESSKIAPLHNMRLFEELLISVIDAPPYLPNWAVYSGPAGFGKTTVGAHVALRKDALLFCCNPTWSAVSMADKILSELNVPMMKGSLSKKVDKIIQLLADDIKPLIFDEADHLAKRGSLIDIVRSVADMTGCPVVLIGEEQLPWRLEQFDRAHSRVLIWQQCLACTFDEAKSILKLRADGIQIADDLLKKIVADVEGNTRRIVVNIERVKNFARTRGLMMVDVAAYTIDIYRGKPAKHFKTAKRVAA